MMSSTLTLQIKPDGRSATLFYDSDYVIITFRWDEAKRAYKITGSTKRWDDLILYNHAFGYYLNRVLKILEEYRQTAEKLEAQRKAAEEQLSGFLSIDEK